MENRAAILYAPRDLRVEDRPMPVPGPRDVLVEVRAVGVCGSDVHYYEHGRIGDFIVTEPLVLGHEAMGVVVDHGEGVRPDCPPLGSRVALEPGVPCGRCADCRSGHYNLCRDVAFFATPPVDGAFARYVILNEDYAHPLPDQVSDVAGALLEPLSVGLWAVRKAAIQPGDRVLVTGAGPVGLLAAQAARIAGAAHIAMTDVNPHRLRMARELGMDDALNPMEDPLNGEINADVLLECSGAPSAVTQGIRLLRSAGTAVLVGMGPGTETSLPTILIQKREITVTGTFRYANTYPAAVALAASGRVTLDAIGTATFGLDDTERALCSPLTDPAMIKPLVMPTAELTTGRQSLSVIPES